MGFRVYRGSTSLYRPCKIAVDMRTHSVDVFRVLICSRPGGTSLSHLGPARRRIVVPKM